MIRSIVYVIFLFFGQVLPVTAQPLAVSPHAREAMEKVQTDSLFEHVFELGSDAYQGRATGTPGCRNAAEYIADRLSAYGLIPLGDRGGFAQRIPMHGSFPLPESRLQLVTGDSAVDLSLWNDYLLLKTGAQTFIPTPVELVFAGYGIVAPEYDYNDYQNIDVTNRIVVFLPGEPSSEDPDFFEGEHNTIHSIPELKMRVALSRGAIGSILLPWPGGNNRTDWELRKTEFYFEDVTLPYTVPGHLSLRINLEKASLLFDGSGYALSDIFRMEQQGKVSSFPLRTRAKFNGVFRERDFLAANVLGMVEGSDPLLRDSYVVCSAHYDHLGIGRPLRGDSIYNGVVDNAIGTAALLELARVISSMDTKPRRSIVFLFVTGEEKGLLGSTYYCLNPVVPLHKTIANVNIDGLAVIDRFRDVKGVGAEYSTLQSHLERVAQELELAVTEVPLVFTILEAFAASDQISFAKAGVPSILVMDGFDYEYLPDDEGYRQFMDWGRRRYHTPFDDLSQPIDKAASLQHARFLLAFVAALADTYEPPQWTRGTKYIEARLKSMIEER